MSERMLWAMTSISKSERVVIAVSESEMTSAPTVRSPSPFETLDDEEPPSTLPSADIESQRAKPT